MYYKETEARDLVIDAGLRLLENKLIARTWGNISARTGPDEFIITPSGRAYDSLKPYDLVKVKISDLSYEGSVMPSSEKGAHAAAYSVRDDASFIIHTHQFYASAVAAECRNVSFAPCAAYALPGTSKLAKNIEKSVRGNPDADCFLLARHGTLILGASLEEAFEKAEKLERQCQALVEKRVPSHDVQAAADFDTEKLRLRDLPFVTVESDPFVLECCRAGIRLGAYIDDFAQIAGPDIEVVDNDPAAVRRALDASGAKVAAGLPGLLAGRNAVLVRGVGAVCAGRTASDAEAVAMIVSKNCAAACYVRHAKPLSALDARLQRYIYLRKYSKRING